MPSTFKSNKVTSSYQPRTQPAGTVSVFGRLSIGTAPGANDVYQLFYVPAGATLLYGYMKPSDMDTGGPTLAFHLGDDLDTDRYLVSTTVGQSTTLVEFQAPITANGFYTYTADNTVDLICTVAATTFVAGTIDFMFLYTMQA